MTDASTPLPSFPGDIPETEIEELLALGRVKGFLTQADLVAVVKDEELDPELINALIAWVGQVGMRFEDIDAIDRAAAQEVLDEPGDAVVRQLRVEKPKKARAPRASRGADVPYDDGRSGA